jgi:predicted transposase YbfD/YdcC
MATGIAGSRSLVHIHSTRTKKKSGKKSEEDRYYLSSQDPGERTPEGWIDLSRAHWAGVENRNHWRRDATLGEDRTRLHQGRALMNLALLRSVNLRLLATEPDEDWLPAQTERLAAHPTSALALLRQRL